MRTTIYLGKFQENTLCFQSLLFGHHKVGNRLHSFHKSCQNNLRSKMEPRLLKTPQSRCQWGWPRSAVSRDECYWRERQWPGTSPKSSTSAAGWRLRWTARPGAPWGGTVSCPSTAVRTSGTVRGIWYRKSQLRTNTRPSGRPHLLRNGYRVCGKFPASLFAFSDLVYFLPPLWNELM